VDLPSIWAGTDSQTNSFDYDLYNGTLKEVHEGAQRNGIRAVPIYAAGHGPAGGRAGRYQLAPGSPGHDAGKRIPNFNDRFSGAGPDIGAHESGSRPMQFGVDAHQATAKQPTRDYPLLSRRACGPREISRPTVSLASTAWGREEGGDGVSVWFGQRADLVGSPAIGCQVHAGGVERTTRQPVIHVGVPLTTPDPRLLEWWEDVTGNVAGAPAANALAASNGLGLALTVVGRASVRTHLHSVTGHPLGLAVRRFNVAADSM